MKQFRAPSRKSTHLLRIVLRLSLLPRVRSVLMFAMHLGGEKVTTLSIYLHFQPAPTIGTHQHDATEFFAVYILLQKLSVSQTGKKGDSGADKTWRGQDSVKN